MTDVRRLGYPSPGTTGGEGLCRVDPCQGYADISCCRITQDTRITRVIPCISEIGMRSARSVFVDEAFCDEVFGFFRFLLLRLMVRT